MTKINIGTDISKRRMLIFRISRKMEIVCPTCVTQLDMFQITGHFGNVFRQGELTTPLLGDYFTEVSLIANSPSGNLNLRNRQQNFELIKVKWTPFTNTVVRIKDSSWHHSSLLAVSDNEKFQTKHTEEEKDCIENAYLMELSIFNNVDELVEHIQRRHPEQFNNSHPLLGDSWTTSSDYVSIIRKTTEVYVEKMRLNEQWQQQRMLELQPAMDSILDNVHLVFKLVKHKIEAHAFTEMAEFTRRAIANTRIWETVFRNLLQKKEKCDHCSYKNKNFCMH